jgi:ubiquinone/menaquinone biosynthesis C-methylase UbiE
MGLGKWYGNAFARIYDPFMHTAEDRIFAQKRHQMLNELRGEILDVGSGTGANFPHFSKKATISAIEPNPKMMDYAQKKHPNHPHIKLILGGMGQPNISFPEAHFDYIVSTLVLCTIPNPEEALNQFKKWLKPNGKLILIEHIRSHSPIKGIAQDVINPAWKLVDDGCNLNRGTDKMVQDAGFKTVSENYFKLGFSWFEGVYSL